MSARVVPIKRGGCSADPCERGQVACPIASACHVPVPEQPRRATGMARAFNAWKRWALARKIRSSERYLDECHKHGITVGRNLEEWHWQLRDMRAQLRALEAQQ